MEKKMLSDRGLNIAGTYYDTETLLTWSRRTNTDRTQAKTGGELNISLARTSICMYLIIGGRPVFCQKLINGGRRGKDSWRYHRKHSTRACPNGKAHLFHIKYTPSCKCIAAARPYIPLWRKYPADVPIHRWRWAIPRPARPIF